MHKHILGIIVLIVAGVNFYWAARIHKLLSFRGTDDEMEIRKKQADRLSALSKYSYIAILSLVGIFLFFKGGWF